MSLRERTVADRADEGGRIPEFEVEIHITPREGILDPEGETIARALLELGHGGVRGVRAGRLVRLRLEADDQEEARRRAHAMCEELIANPVIEEYGISVAPSVFGDAGESDGADAAGRAGRP